MLSGYPWGTIIARNTLMSLPGNTLAIDHRKDFEEIMDTMAHELTHYMNTGQPSVKIHGIDMPDIPLWAVWTVQQYAKNVSMAEAPNDMRLW